MEKVHAVCKKVSSWVMRSSNPGTGVSVDDVTNELFVDVLERDLLSQHDPDKATLETYLIMCLKQTYVRKFIKGKQNGFERSFYRYGTAESVDDEKAETFQAYVVDDALLDEIDELEVNWDLKSWDSYTRYSRIINSDEFKSSQSKKGFRCI